MRAPRATRTDILFPYPTRFRSLNPATIEGASISGDPLTLVGAATNRVVITLKGDGGSVQGTVSDRNRRGIPKAGIVLLSVDDRRDDPPSYRDRKSTRLNSSQ